MRILIVEDDLQLADMLTETLANRQYKVDVAQDGKLALSKIEALPPDLVLMDAMTRPLEKSCQKLKAAWMSHTSTKTMASARLASAGGSPRGFQATKTMMAATNRMEPKPPNR